MDPVTLTIAALAVAAGTVLQRVSGTGVGLVVAPILALLYGPVAGVVLTNALTPVTALFIMISVWRHVEWRHAGVIILTALPGVVAGAWLTLAVPTAVLMVLVGIVVVAGLAVAAFAHRLPEISRRVGVVPAGFFGGLFNAVAGIAAPALVVYSRMTRWDQRSFAATMQPVFAAIGLGSLIAKLAGGATLDLGDGWPIIVGVLLAVAIVGIVLGSWAEKRVTKATAAQVALGLAGLGGVLTIAKGAIELLS